MPTVTKLIITAKNHSHWNQIHEYMHNYKVIGGDLEAAKGTIRYLLQSIIDFDIDLKNRNCSVSGFNFGATKHFDLEIIDPHSGEYVIEFDIYY